MHKKMIEILYKLTIKNFRFNTKYVEINNSMCYTVSRK